MAARLILLLKSGPGSGAKIANQAGYAFYGSRWHKVTVDKPAPKGAPLAHHPQAAGQHMPAAHFTDEQWAALKLPDTNVNAPAYNKALDKLKEWSDSGNVTAIVGAGYGTNTYGQKLAKIANHLLALYGSPHKVTSGQKAGTHAATQAPAEPAPLPDLDSPEDMAATYKDGKVVDAGPYAKLSDQLKAVLSSDMHAKVDAFVAALNSGEDEQEAFDAADFGMQAVAAQKVLASKHGMHVVAKAPAQFQPAAAPEPKPAAPAPSAGPVKMPEFAEGKTVTGVKALYEKVGQKIIDHAHAGNVSVLEGIPEPHKKMWQGKTPNSKKLLALHAEAMAYAKGETKPAAEPIAGWKAAIAAGKTPTKAQAEAMDALEESDPDAHMEAFMTAAIDSIPADKNNDADYDAALEAAHEQAHQLHADALAGGHDAPVTIDDGPKEGDTKPAADGGTLVLKDGHWVKQGGDEAPVLAGVSASDFVSGIASADLMMSDLEEKAKQWLAENPGKGADLSIALADYGYSNVAAELGLPSADDGEGFDPFADAPEPKSQPATLGNLSAQHLQNLQSIPWYKLKLPDSNTNAATVNKKLQAIQDAAFAGNVAQLHAMKFGSNTYGKKLALLAQTAIAALGGNATAAVPVEPAPAVAQQPSEKVTSLTPKQIAGLHGWFKAGKPTSKHPDSWSNLWSKLSPGMKAAVKAELEAEDPPAEASPPPEPAKKPRITADTPLTEGQQQAVDGLGKEALEALAEDGQPLPANVKAAIKKKLAEMNGSAGVDTSVLGAAEKAMLHKLIASNDLNGLETASKYGSPPAYKQAAGEALAKLKASMPKTATAVKTTLHNTTAGHNKSWSVYVAPNASGGFDMVAEYGKIGGTQQKTVKPFSSAGAAQVAALKLINEKKAKGYVLKDTDYGHKVVVQEPQKPAMPTPPAGVDKSNFWMKWVTVSIEAGATDSLDGYINALKNSDDPDAPAILKYAQQGMEYLTGEKAQDDGPKEGDTKQGADGLLVLKNGHWVKMGEGDPSAVEWDYDPSDMAMSGAATLTAEGDNGATFYIAYDGDTFQVGKMDPGGDVSDDYQDFASLSDAAAYLKDELGGSVPPLASLQKLDKNFKASDLPGAKSAAAPSAAPASSGALEPMDSWTQTGGQGGSNPGGKFKDASGQEWYVKWPDDAEAVKSEVLAAKLYALAGLSSQDAKLVTKGGKIAIASKWVNIKKAGSGADLAKVPGALEGFAVDAWLGNWDVVGLSLDNLQIGPDGKAHRVDAGGSLEYRAQGEKKPFGAKVEEIDTLRDAKKNPKAASVFGKMTDADIAASVVKVLSISDAQIKALVMSHGPGSEEAKAKLAETLIARKKDLAAKYPQAAKKAKLATFKIENISKPPSFTNWNGSGKGLSSVPAINEANEAAVQSAYDAAIRGNLDKIKSAVAPVFDKSTHQVVGHKPLHDHPSSHVKAYWADLVNEVDLQLNPPQMPEIGTVVFDEDMAAISSALKPVPSGKTVSAVDKSQKIGSYILLGKYAGTTSSVMPKKDNSVISGSAWVEKAKAAYNAASNAAKSTFSTYVTTSGARALNTALRDGNLSTTVSGKTVSQHVKDFQGLLVDIPPGSTFVRRMGMHGYGSKPNEKAIKALQQFLMSAEAGTVVQEPGFSSTSWSEGNTILSNNDIEWRFTAAKGVKMFPGWLTANKGEGEGLLPPNQRYMIMGAKKVGKTVQVEAVLLPTI